MVTSFPSFRIGDKVLNTETGKKGIIIFVHVSSFLEYICYYNVIYDDNSQTYFENENELQKIHGLREPI